jgi:integrase
MGGKRLKSKVLKKPIEQYESVRDVLSGLKESTKRSYRTKLGRFFEWIGKDPDAVLEERRNNIENKDIKIKRIYEREVVRYHEFLLKKTDLRESSARMEIGAVQAFFSRNYADLIFRKGDIPKPRMEERYVVPTLPEIKEMVESTFSPRDKAVIILAVQTGLAPIDLIGLKRAPFERAIQKEEYPVFVGKIPRHKTAGTAYVFLMRDSAEALKRYLRNRKDGSDLLFVERAARPMQVNSVNKIVKKAAERAKLYQDKDQLIKGYVLRKVFETQCQKSGMPQPWIDLCIGHEVKGSRGAYTRPSETELLEKVKAAESFLSITHVRNIDLLRDRIDKAREGDTLGMIMMLENTLGEERLKNMARNYLSMKGEITARAKIHREEKADELMPSERVLELALSKYLALKGEAVKLKRVKLSQLESM